MAEGAGVVGSTDDTRQGVPRQFANPHQGADITVLNKSFDPIRKSGLGIGPWIREQAPATRVPIKV